MLLSCSAAAFTAGDAVHSCRQLLTCADQPPAALYVHGAAAWSGLLGAVQGRSCAALAAEAAWCGVTPDGCEGWP